MASRPHHVQLRSVRAGDDDSIERSNRFTHVGAHGTPKDLHATVEGVAKLKHSRNLVVSRGAYNERLGSRSKPKFADCRSYQKTMIKMAAEEAQRLLVEAIAGSEEVKRLGSPAHGGYYEIWFGEYSEIVADTIWFTLEGIITNLPFLGFTYDCNCNEVVPSEISEFTLQLCVRRSVTDESLAQSSTAVESGSADPSGTSCQMKNRLNLSAWPASASSSVISHSA